MSKPGKSAGGSNGSIGAVTIDSVADILERELQPVITDWLYRVEQEPDLTCIPMNFEERTGHLPALMSDVINRLRLDAGNESSDFESCGPPWGFAP
jgi:hypothetical protein